MLVAVEAGSLLRGFILLLSLPFVTIAYLFVSEALGIQILIFISFAGLKIRDIELASGAVLPRFYVADVRRESFEVFDRCKRKVVVTANPTVMVDAFVKDYLGGDKICVLESLFLHLPFSFPALNNNTTNLPSMEGNDRFAGFVVVKKYRKTKGGNNQGFVVGKK
ncbi:putative glycerol-3-phosphate acyltransferase 8 [Trifolium repens]|nr:putative glycerol-3-phosphate acyltransferase 8 [Trifolium repens]